jgi:hypothetical protein
MDQFTQDVQEIVGTKPYFGMYTEHGNNVVAALVKHAKHYSLSWPELYAEMARLSQNDETLEEMMDTMVREIVYDSMGYTTNFYI